MKKNKKYLSILVLVLAISTCFGIFYSNEEKLDYVLSNDDTILAYNLCLVYAYNGYANTTKYDGPL